MTKAELRHEYVSAKELAAQPLDWWASVLGVVGFEKPPVFDGRRVPSAASMTPPLSPTNELCEVWRVASAETAFASNDAGVTHGRVHYRHGAGLLFGCLTLDESRYDERVPRTAGGDEESAALLHATQSGYEDIFRVLEQTHHRHLIRVWNYLPEINREVGGDERYRHFNSARQSAFRNSGRATVGSVPAACALGSPAGSLISIFFIASREPPTMIENPRQTSAYHYPRKFGIDSPTFSRACMLGEATGTNLFVSGTASIVGHETVHRGDVAAQTRESIVNIDALVVEANRMLGKPRYTLDGLKFKVYVRSPADLEAIKRTLAATLTPATPIVYLQADVCREDLLVEIEATGAC